MRWQLRKHLSPIKEIPGSPDPKDCAGGTDMGADENMRRQLTHYIRVGDRSSNEFMDDMVSNNSIDHIGEYLEDDHLNSL